MWRTILTVIFWRSQQSNRKQTKTTRLEDIRKPKWSTYIDHSLKVGLKLQQLKIESICHNIAPEGNNSPCIILRNQFGKTKKTKTTGFFNKKKLTSSGLLGTKQKHENIKGFYQPKEEHWRKPEPQKWYPACLSSNIYASSVWFNNSFLSTKKFEQV